jgi:hypothetical protein
MLRLSLLVAVFALVGACSTPKAPPPPVLPPTATEPPFLSVAVEQEKVAPGREQALAVTLDADGATTIILQLTITYPGGTTQAMIDQTFGQTATLNWLVPGDAQRGVAQFQLKTSGCGCGDRSLAGASTDLESTAEGYFYVGE